mmetsp:Transcript_18095/g.26869  ORF Transcript_18095/g.26869 Transcript_18095/m.26869 type:complete len:330 (-) Transcript_18095:252-1241(-)
MKNCVLPIALSATINSVSSFQGTSFLFLQRPAGFIQHSSFTRASAFLPTKELTRRPATIYSWDDSDDQTLTSAFDYDSNAMSTPLHTQNHVAELLSQDKDRTATLARLAAAFSKDSSLKLENIRHVEILAVDNGHIDISAVVCDDETCVTILVPIDFLYTCSDDCGREECILGNIFHLDELAMKALEKQTAQISLDNDFLRDYYSQASIDYPWWWIGAREVGGSLTPNTDMVRACDDMKALLNNVSFEDEIKHFACRLVATQGHGSQHEVLQARVTAVGARGFCMRVLVVDERSSQKQVSQVDVSYKFEHEISDASMLRSAVLVAFNSD